MDAALFPRLRTDAERSPESMTDEEIRNLILMKSEGPNLDYKAGFAWTKDKRDKKYDLIRDLMALSNMKDGGRVIFGVRDEDSLSSVFRPRSTNLLTQAMWSRCCMTMLHQRS